MREPPLDPRIELGLQPHQLPRHVAIIMDGNGRWASQRNQPRIFGHEAGARAVRAVVTHCARLGLECLTLYSFSAENWKRPRQEVEFLMELYARYLVAERDEIMQNDVRLLHIGRRAGLSNDVLREMDLTVELSRSNGGLKLCLALNYGSRLEIVEAIQRIASQVKNGQRDPCDINEEVVSNALYTAGLPDPDLLIRTANERRISNFLLWQISYSEIHVTPCLWPDFDVHELNAAFKEFAARERRFGDVKPNPTTSA